MRKIKVIIVVILFGVLSGSCFLSNAYARNKKVNPAIYVEMGKVAYKNGNIERAVEEFNMALTVDSENKEAKRLLEEISTKRSGLYARARATTSRVASLSRHIEVYEDMLGVLEKQKAKIEKRFNSILQERDSLKEECGAVDIKFDSLQREARNVSKTKDRKARKMVVKQKRKSKDLARAKKSLERLQKRYKKIVKRANQYEDRVSSLSDDCNRLREQLFVRNNENEKAFKEIDDYLYVRKNKIDELQDQLIFKDLELVKKEKVFLSRLDEIAILNQSVIHYQEGIEDRDAFIKRRNKQISVLEQDLNAAKNRIEKLLAEKE